MNWRPQHQKSFAGRLRHTEYARYLDSTSFAWHDTALSHTIDHSGTIRPDSTKPSDRTMLSATLLVIGGLLFGQVATAPPADVAARVRNLVADFESPQKATRDAAEKELIEFGPAALATL